MGGLVKGDVVVLPYPFDDLSGAKKRPALVLAAFPGHAVLLCHITSQAAGVDHEVRIQSADFSDGGLHKLSYARADRLFTANARIILSKAGTLNAAKVREVVDKIVIIVTA